MNSRGCAYVSVAVFLAARGEVSAQVPLFVEPHRMLPDDFDQTMEFAIGDFDGDGDQDLVAANHGPCRLYRNGGDARFEFDPDALPLPTAAADEIAAGDVDGDGDLDLFLTSYIPSTLALYLNDGAARFTDASDRLPIGLPGGETVALGDVDRDGDLDAYVGSSAPDLLLINDGVGTFIDGSTRLPVMNAWTMASGFADLDDDGDLDLVITEFNVFSPIGYVLRNNGTASFAAEPLPSTMTQARDVALGDVDDDGDVDLLFVGFQDIQLYLNTGAGSFANGSGHLPNLPGNPTSVVLVDLTGDGSLDIWAVKSGQDWYFRNDGNGLFTDASSLVPPSTAPMTGVDAADLDEDGDVDLVGSAQFAASRLLLNDGAGAFLDATVIGQPDGSHVSCAALADVDGDGDLDGVFGSASELGPRQNQLFLNDGTGAMEEVTATHLPVDHDYTTAVALGDIEGDSDLDLVAGNFLSTSSQPGYEKLYLNDGSGHFIEDSARLGTPVSDSTEHLALADLDGDAHVDLFVVNNPDPARLLLNDGTGYFLDASGRLPAGLTGTKAAVADLDGDDDLDLFVTDGHGGSGGERPNRLLLNDGSANFADASAQLPPHVERSTCVALADVDADGDADAFVGNLADADPDDRLYLNDGNAVFTDASSQLPAYSHSTSACALVDFDRDGDPDLLIAGTTVPLGGPGDRLFLNDGGGNFTEATDLLMPVPTSSFAFAVGDADADGDLDYLTAGEGNAAEHLMRNASVHLAWRALPRLSRPLEMEVRGRPGAAFVLVASRADVAPADGPCGVVRIDRERVVLTRAGMLDADGAAVVSFDVPGDPALAGLTLHWQALIRPAPCEWTNLERTTFSPH